MEERKMENKDYSYELGNLIQKYRKEKKLTQEDLAGLLSTDRNVISRYERGETIPSAIILMQIAQCLDEPMDSFVPQKLKCKNNYKNQIRDIFKKVESQILELL